MIAAAPEISGEENDVPESSAKPPFQGRIRLVPGATM
jgi:hypothetical protein